jgi:hypothetical protein
VGALMLTTEAMVAEQPPANDASSSGGAGYHD